MTLKNKVLTSTLSVIKRGKIMSKELKDLQILRGLVEYLTRIDDVDDVPTALKNQIIGLLIKSYEDSNGFFSQIEEALNELEDAKHNYKAVKEMYNNSVAYATNIQKELNELKKRNEPMKPLLKDMGFEHYYFYCPSCKIVVGVGNPLREALAWNYCPDCGQKLDWRDEK